MFDENVAGEPVDALIGKYLLVHCPGKRLANLVAQISHSLHRCVLSVVCVHDAHEVIFGQCLEVVEQVFDLLQVLVFLGLDPCEQAGKTVNDDQSQVNLKLSFLELPQKHRKQEEQLL